MHAKQCESLGCHSQLVVCSQAPVALRLAFHDAGEGQAYLHVYGVQHANIVYGCAAATSATNVLHRSLMWPPRYIQQGGWGWRHERLHSF